MKKTCKLLLHISILLSLGATPVLAVPISQYASSVVGFSSEYIASGGRWSAAQALGAPNTFAYGDIETAWAPSLRNGTLEFITLGFGTAVYATGATIRETFGNGFVYEVEARDTSGVYHSVWSGTDTSLAGTPVDFTVSWATTSYLVDALRIRVDTDHNLAAYEEIDSVTLLGLDSVPDAGSTLALLGLGLTALAGLRRKFSAGAPA